MREKITYIKYMLIFLAIPLISNILLPSCSSAIPSGRMSSSYNHAVIHKTDDDGPPPNGFNSRRVKPLKLVAQKQSEYGNDPYLIDDKVYIPKTSAKGYYAKGIASWYGTQFHKKSTSSKETYDIYALTAAHKTLPLPTYVRVTNIENKKSIIVKVNDRGPFVNNRLIDLSYAAANKLGFAKKGTAYVSVKAIAPYSAPANHKKINNNKTVKSFSLQFAAFHKLANARKYQKIVKSTFKKQGIRFTPKINKQDELYLLEGTVRTIAQYNKVKNLIAKAKLTQPFITKINTTHKYH